MPDKSTPGADDALTAVTEELAVTRALRDRMSELLTGVAAALKGDPPALTMHDWSDLPALAAELRRQVPRPEGDDPMPVFVIKAKDQLAPAAVNAYRAACTLHGLSEQAEQADLARIEIIDWQHRHPETVQLPDHQHVPAQTKNSPTSDPTALADRILHVLAQPEWQEEPPGSGLIAEILHERRRDVTAALAGLIADGKVKNAGGNNRTGTAGFTLADQGRVPAYITEARAKAIDAILAADWGTVRKIAMDPYAAGDDIDRAKGALAGAAVDPNQLPETQ